MAACLATVMLVAPVPGSTHPLPAGYEDVAQELAEAGQGMSPQRLVDLAGTPAERSWWVSLGGVGSGGGWRREARIRREGNMVQGDLRSWWWEDGVHERAGWAAAHWPGGSLLVGGWGWRSGFGLLVGGVGRRRTLAADAGLGPGGRGRQAWSRPPAPRSVLGAAGRQVAGPLVVGLGAGRMDEGDVVLAALSDRAGRMGLTAVRESGRGAWAGGHFRWRRGSWFGGAEMAVPVRRTGMDGLSLAASCARRLGPSSLVEVLGMMSPPATSILASLPAPLGSGGGSGWALRGTHRLSADLRLAVLVARGLRRDSRPGVLRHLQADALLQGRTATGLWWEAGWRTTTSVRGEWTDGAPWLPPDEVPQARRRALALQVRDRTPPLTWRLELRRLALADGQRALATAAGGWRHPEGWDLRGGLAHAWGAPVDLVSVLVPVPGRVLARHWGHWQGETWLGLGRGQGAAAWSLSVHLRRPAWGGQIAVSARCEIRVAH